MILLQASREILCSIPTALDNQEVGSSMKDDLLSRFLSLFQLESGLLGACDEPSKKKSKSSSKSVSGKKDGIFNSEISKMARELQRLPLFSPVDGLRIGQNILSLLVNSESLTV